MSDNPLESQLRAAENVREDLEVIAQSNLPFSDDAAKILDAIDEIDTDEVTDR
ncbi:hypothetical protein [Halovenus halobia]|uniref:hypothetical protein n=1 Tax=Halovenus halobia TaxID=3396622 RepID=UPI003F566ED2